MRPLAAPEAPLTMPARGYLASVVAALRQGEQRGAPAYLERSATNGSSTARTPTSPTGEQRGRAGRRAGRDRQLPVRAQARAAGAGTPGARPAWPVRLGHKRGATRPRRHPGSTPARSGRRSTRRCAAGADEQVHTRPSARVGAGHPPGARSGKVCQAPQGSFVSVECRTTHGTVPLGHDSRHDHRRGIGGCDCRSRGCVDRGPHPASARALSAA